MSEAIIVDTGQSVELCCEPSLPTMYIRLGGVSLLRRQIEALRSAGFNSITLITDEPSEKIESALNWPVPLKKNDLVFKIIPPKGSKFVQDLMTPSALIIPSDMFFTKEFAESLREGFSINNVGKGWMRFIRSKRDIEEVEKYLYRNLISPTDSLLTRKINRKISLVITRRISNLSIHPNHITVFNFIVGITGGLLLFSLSYFPTILGAFLFLLSSILDGCDGELARLRYQKSRFGGLLDVVTDNIVHWVVFSGLTYRSVRLFGFLPYGVFGLSLMFSSIASFLFSLYASLWYTSGHKSSGGLIFSESPLGDLLPGADLLDRLANRDFAYLLLLLSIFNHLEWFTIVGGIGAPLFAFMLFRSLKLRGVL